MSDQRQIKSCVWHGLKCYFVSTILRESSACGGPTHYNETMVWPYDWEKAERGANFIFQDGTEAGSIGLHNRVCERIYHTGNPEDLILACKSHAPLSRAWSELAYHANALANAKTKAERDAAALKVFTAIGDAKDALPELRTLSEARAALQSAKE